MNKQPTNYTKDQLKDMLNYYKNHLDDLTKQESLLLTEFFIKHKLLKENKYLPEKFNEKDLLKYAFLGYYVYSEIDQNLQSYE
jgi:hypothetical protein